VRTKVGELDLSDDDDAVDKRIFPSRRGFRSLMMLVERLRSGKEVSVADL
jgi:hypothetical protein